MNNKYTFGVLLLVVIGVGLLVVHIASGGIFELLDPKGIVALQERSLLLAATILMLMIVVPIFVLTLAIAWRYRAENAHAKYTPNWEHSLTDEFIWWLAPTAIIGAIAIMTWQSSHTLDPYKPLASSNQPLTIQVVALNWKWLFIYPDQGIATVNYVQFPENTPIDFEITADAPMNSFWIPQLGGQIYAMEGMVTHLHLIADAPDTYRGLSSNFSGTGFAGMQFTAESSSREDFDQWVANAKRASEVLDAHSYQALSQPSIDAPVVYYRLGDTTLYNAIVNRFTTPTDRMTTSY